MRISLRFVVLGLVCGLLGCGSVTPNALPDAGGEASAAPDASPGTGGQGGDTGAAGGGGAPSSSAGGAGGAPIAPAASAPACTDPQPPQGWHDCGIEIAGAWQCVTGCIAAGCLFHSVTYCAPSCGDCR